MTRSQYQTAREELARQESNNEPYLEAIDKFDRALTLSEGTGAIVEEQPAEVRRAECYYQRGYAHLRAGQLDKAIEDFEIGRRATPNDLRLLQAYAYAKSLKNERQKGDLPSVEERSGEDSLRKSRNSRTRMENIARG
jgi:tetratricopeptide (TPR) repeat protein